MKVLLLGSTKLTELVGERLAKSHEVVGFVASKNPTVPGKMRWPEILVPSEPPPVDMTLSVQYDRKWPHFERGAYNLHTGLLPLWGGTGILWHTIDEGASEQGLTFHAMTEDLDSGPLVGQISYPVLDGDTVLTLYGRMLDIAPGFAEACVNLVESIGHDRIENECDWVDCPRMFKRGDIPTPALPAYRKTLEALRRRYS